jgi:hypothetical protein
VSELLAKTFGGYGRRIPTTRSTVVYGCACVKRRCNRRCNVRVSYRPLFPWGGGVLTSTLARRAPRPNATAAQYILNTTSHLA